MSLPMDNTLYWHAKLVLEETHVISFKFGVFSVLMLHASSPTWFSCLTETVVPLPLLGLVTYMVSIEAPRLWLYPVRPCSHWEGGWRSCHSHPSAASLKGGTQSGSRDASGTGAASIALPTPRKRKCGLPLTSVCLLSARDSHHCHVQGTLCSRVV